MLRGAVDNQPFKRREKVALRIGQAILIRSVLAEFRAQLCLNVGGAGYLDAAQLQPLELGEQVIPRRRRQARGRLPFFERASFRQRRVNHPTVCPWLSEVRESGCCDVSRTSESGH